MAEETLNLYQKLAKIRKLSGVVAKSKRGYNYTYSDITEILANVTAGMDKYGVSLIPIIVPGTAMIMPNTMVDVKVDKQGKPYEKKTTEMLFSAEMIYKWVNTEDPDDYIEVPWFVTGSQADPSQALGGGLTYCNRQFLTNYFQIAQVDNDVDAYRSKQKEAEVSEEKSIAENIIGEVDKLCKEYLAEHKDDAEKVKTFMAKYAKKSNYLSIKEPKLAAKLLGDFKKTFLGEEVKEEE